jgi:hypothetical protein
MAARALGGRLTSADRVPTPAAIAAAGALLVLVSALAFQLARRAVGVAFSSDTYSYLVWARRAVHEGELGHTPYDYTAPKPLEMLVATIGEVLGAPVAFFGTWAILSYLAALIAVSGLAWRLGGTLAAVTAGALALFLPPLVLHGYAADSTVPYAACVIGAVALSPLRRVPASCLLGIAGLLRPEAWGLAGLHAALTWRRSAVRERAVAVASALAPPAVWLTFDWIATGDALYGAHAADRFGVLGVPVQDVPQLVERVAPSLLGWPLLALGLVALAAGLARRPGDPAVIFPLAIAAGLVLELQLQFIGAQTIDRYGLVLALFFPVGAGVVLASVPGRARLPTVIAGVALCFWSVADELREVRVVHERRGRAATELEGGMAGAARRAVANGGLLATERQWQGATALYGRIPRERVVPVGEVGRNEDPDALGAFLVIAGRQERRAREGPTPLDGLEPDHRSRRWRLYVIDGAGIEAPAGRRR